MHIFTHLIRIIQQENIDLQQLLQHVKRNERSSGECSDLQQQILEYNIEKNNLENIRTPKRHHSGEKKTNNE
jgi:hypothetical protein